MASPPSVTNVARFKRFRLAEKLHKDEGDIQVSYLLYAMGDESETIFKTFALTEQNDFDTVMSKFDTYFRPKVNYLEYRVSFQNRVQNYDEPNYRTIRQSSV